MPKPGCIPTSAPLALLVAAVALLADLSSAQYLDVYPERDTGDGNGTKPLYFGLMQAFGGGYDGRNNVLGVQVALDEINSDPSMLPGYRLHYTLSDSQCNREMGLEEFFRQIFTDPVKFAWLGSGCSTATEPTAEISPFYNMTQVSCVSSSPVLSNHDVFKYYFQVLPADDGLAMGFFAIIRRYGWRHVAIIQQDENIFTVTMDRLKRLLDDIGVTYSEMSFASEKGVAGLGANPFDEDARIFVLSMYERHARDMICEAHARGIKYPTHLLVTYMYTWYRERWWMQGENHTCTVEQREEVMEYALGPIHFDFISNYSMEVDTGITGFTFNDSYYQHLNDSSLSLLDRFQASSIYCYDATWTLAYALNRTIADLLSNYTLRTAAGEEAGLAVPNDFQLSDFTYQNNIIAQTMFRYLEETDFTGLTGPIKFDDEGVRQEGLLVIRQLRYNQEFGQLERTDIGNGMGQGNETSFEYISGWTDATVWPVGIPYDGIPIEEVVTVEVPLTVVYTLLAAAGIAFTTACLLFNFVFRQRKLIRLTSPNLNYVIGAGAFVLYVEVILLVVPTTNRDAVSALCNVTPWLTSLGYSLCFGTMVAKMARVYYIFNNPGSGKKTKLSDWKLLLVVLILVVVDLVILVTYTTVECARGNLGAERISNTENPSDTKGERKIEYKYFVYICTSTSRDITLGILYGYKAVLQVVSLLFAFQIRKVKVKGLNDAKYIAAAVYVTSIILAVILVCTYTLDEYVNIYPSVVGLGLLLGTTAILILMFVPTMIGLYQDPEGEHIFASSSAFTQQQDGMRAQTQIPLDTVLKSNSEPKLDEVATLRNRITELETKLAAFEKYSEAVADASVLGECSANGTQESKVTFSTDGYSSKGSNETAKATESAV